MFESHCNLTAPPFRLTPDPQFFYGSETHRRALAHLEYGLGEGEGFAVLTGDVGTGKSTVIAHLLARMVVPRGHASGGAMAPGEQRGG